MKKSITIVTLAAALSAGIIPAGAQVIYKMNTKMNVTGVNNDGVAVGYPDLNTPYYLWRAVEKGPDQSAEDLELIGGMGPGDGIGGHGRFSDDGKLVSAVNICNVLLPSGWENTLEMPSVEIMDLFVPLRDVAFVGMAVGVDAETGESVILKTTNEGQSWKKYKTSDVEGGLKQGAINTVSTFNRGFLLLGGENGLFYTGNLGGAYFNVADPRPEGITKNVKSYKAISFIDVSPYYGVMTVEYEDGTAGVWQTEGEGVYDSGISFTDVTENIEDFKGIPTSVVNDGKNFYMATDAGFVYKSTDNGKTWSALYNGGSSVKFVKLAVSEEGMIVGVCGDAKIRICIDGNYQWRTKSVPGSAEDFKWYTAAFNGNKIIVAGANGQIYSSEDLGDTWKNEAEDISSTGDIYALNVNSYAMIAGGTDGCLARKLADTEKEGVAMASIYNMETEEWTALKSTGYLGDISGGSAYDISGDGSYVVGLAPWKESDGVSRSHATVWSTETGVPVDLGTRVEGKATRANGVSYDGSVVVGWQDFHGPWFGSVWRRGADGYTQEFIYSHKDASEKDLNFADEDNLEQNLALELRSVSTDGKWLGGKGGERSLIKNPYIYSIETGIIELTDNGVGGTVSDINNDGDIAIGWYGIGESGWIWTKEDGIMEINDFAKNVLGAEYTGTLCSAYDMSPNGRFVIGYGMDGQGVFGYMLDLKQWLEDRETGTGIADVTVYPNPATNELHIDLLRDGNAHVNLYDLTGRKVYSRKVADTSNVVDISSVKNGIYVLEVQTGNARKTMKFQVKH